MTSSPEHVKKSSKKTEKKSSEKKTAVKSVKKLKRSLEGGEEVVGELVGGEEVIGGDELGGGEKTELVGGNDVSLEAGEIVEPVLTAGEVVEPILGGDLEGGVKKKAKKSKTEDSKKKVSKSPRKPHAYNVFVKEFAKNWKGERKEMMKAAGVEWQKSKV